MRSRLTPTLLSLCVVAGLLTSATAQADELVVSSSTNLLSLDVDSAVATSTTSSTRWMRLNLAAETPNAGFRAMWLVSVRPGARLDWSPDSWFYALEEATATRMLPPSKPLPACQTAQGPERIPSWTKLTDLRVVPIGMTEHATEDSLLTMLSTRAFQAPTSTTELYANGAHVVALELAGVGLTPTLRVHEAVDLGGRLPLPTFHRFVGTRATTYTFTSGPSTIAGVSGIALDQLWWGADKSNYETLRWATLMLPWRTSSWLKELSAHDVVFVGGAHVGTTTVTTPPLAGTFFKALRADPSPCVAAAGAAAARPGVVGLRCPAGAVLRADGPACVSAPGDIEATTFACEGNDDLSLALAGLSATTVHAGRFAGYLRSGSADPALVPTEAQSTLLNAGGFNACPYVEPPLSNTPSSEPATPSAPMTPPPSTIQRPGSSTSEPALYIDDRESCSSSSDQDIYVEGDGCTGGSATASDGSDDDSTDDSSDDSTDDSSDDSTDDSNDDSTDDSSDDSTDDSSWTDAFDDASSDSTSSDDACSPSSSSSSSGDDSDDETDDSTADDSCGGSSSSSSSSSGDWASPKTGKSSPQAVSTSRGAKKPAKKPKKTKRAKKRPAKHARGRSPVSRVTLLLSALILPLRRRRSGAREESSNNPAQ